MKSIPNTTPPEPEAPECAASLEVLDTDGKPLLWITNTHKDNRRPVLRTSDYVEGDPVGSDTSGLATQTSYTVAQLRELGMIGIYVRMSAKEYYALPVVTGTTQP